MVDSLTRKFQIEKEHWASELHALQDLSAANMREKEQLQQENTNLQRQLLLIKQSNNQLQAELQGKVAENEVISSNSVAQRKGTCI